MADPKNTRPILNDDKYGNAYGYEGVKGDRFTEVPGWESTTVGFAGNIYSRLASENGIQPVDPAVTASREPFKAGRFLIKIMKMVPFFHKKVAYTWRHILEDTALSLSGINNYTFNTFQKQHGVVKQNSTYGGIYQETNGDFTVKVPEYAGQLVRKAIDYWIFGMSDPKTGVATYYGKPIRDLQPNKSMSILYVLLGPTCRPDDIEYACMWHDAIIKESQHAHNNSGELGDAGNGQEFDLNFGGTFDKSAEIDTLARIVVAYEGLYQESYKNALLPDYIYKEYFADTDGITNIDTNIHYYSNLIRHRLNNELELSGRTDTDDSGRNEGIAYNSKSNNNKNRLEDYVNTVFGKKALDKQDGVGILNKIKEAAGIGA